MKSYAKRHWQYPVSSEPNAQIIKSILNATDCKVNSKRKTGQSEEGEQKNYTKIYDFLSWELSVNSC